MSKMKLAGVVAGFVGLAEAATVAYWPMNLTEAGATRRVLDASPSGFYLTVRDAALEGLSFRENDIGWTLPPLADACGVESTQYLTSSPGKKDGSNYKQALTSSNRQLCEALAGHHDFTLEGWARLTALPSGSDKYLFAMNTLAQKGGWAWQFLPPTTGHAGGCLQIRDRVVFGKNPGKVPYVFLRAETGTDTQTWQYGTNTEFAVANITEDDNPDVTFDCHVMAMKAWQDETGSCSFRKTGDGTMVLGQSRDGYSSSHVCYPTGAETVNHIEAGELRIDCDYTGPSFDVASGAFLSGTGCVSSVTFETGAGMKGALGASEALSIMGDCRIMGTGTVSLRVKNASRYRVTLATVAGEIAGADNLESWFVSLDGVPDADYSVVVEGRKLVAKKDVGMLLLFR